MSLQEQLNQTVESLGVKHFDVASCTVSVADVIAKPDQFQLLDARTDEEREVGVIPGSITRAEFESNPDSYKDKKVVAYCTVGYLSGACTRELRNAGHDNINNLGDGALLGYTLAQTKNGK